MAPERDWTSDLAEEVRAAIAETSRTPVAQAPPAEEEKIRVPLGRAAEHITPSVPAGARLSRAKRSVLRLLRLLWRDQASYNALLIESVNALADRVGDMDRRLRELLEAERRDRDRQVSEIKRRVEETAQRHEREELQARRRAAIQDGRLAILEAGRAPARTAPSNARRGEASLPAGVYSLFEERFRGSAEEISEKQRSYVPLLRSLPGPVLDIGCGRGELVRLLAAEGIPASGVEINPITASAAASGGVSVEQGDGLAALARRPPGSLGGVVALQVVEHWPAETTFAFLREARRAIAPGGVLIVETINSDSLSALKAFFLDPSHVRPVPPDALKFLAEAAGFADARIEYRSPMSSADRLEETSPNDAKLNRLLFAPQDYALVAYAPDSGLGTRDSGLEDRDASGS